MDKMNDQELISALADGQLRGAAFARGVAAASDPAGRRTWQAYHLAGEVLRQGQATPAHDSEAFLARLRTRLADEAPLAAPVEPAMEAALARVAVQPAVTPARPEVLTERLREPAANDWRWKIAAGVASVAAVVAVGWNVAGTATGNAQPQLAVAPAPQAPAGAQPAAMLRDPRLDRLLAAHRQLGGATALQSTSGFLRNATFEGPAR